MKCGCGKEIVDISLSFKKGENYYHNELCFLESIKKDYNKRINDMLQYYYSFNNKNNVVPIQYYFMFNKLKKELNNEKYVMFFLYNSRDNIYEINCRYQYCSNNTRMYKVWEYLRDNIYLMLPNFYIKEQEIINLPNDNEVRIKKRHKNKLLED